MQNIKLSPIREAVIEETLKRSQADAKKYVDKYAIVTYDLAVAKMARQIQIQNSPEFDDCFIQSGQLKPVLSVISPITKTLEGSGTVYLLSEVKIIIAGGSINKFQRGKSYSRCRSGSLLLSTTMHGLHLERFIEDMRQLICCRNLETGQVGKICPGCPAIFKDLYLEETL